MTENTINQETLDTPEVPEETPTQPTDAVTPEVLAKELERARKEAAKYRTRLREREEAEQKALEEQRRAEQTAEERARELQQQLEAKEREAHQRVLTAERKAQLAGRVSNPNRVLKLMEDPDEYFDGVEANLDRILEDFPEYAPTHNAKVAPAPTGAPSPAKTLTLDQLKSMTPEEINANWDVIQASLERK
jgi:hypothetical protein